MTHKIIITMLIAVGAGILPLPTWAGEGLAAGISVPTFTLYGINVPKRFNLKKYFNREKAEENKVVLITFFASWCKPCKKELPHLQQTYQQYQDKGLEIMAVYSEPDNVDWAKKFWDEHGLGFLLLNDEYGIVKKRYEVAEYPTSFVVGTDGKLIQKFIGYSETIEAQADSLLSTLMQ